VKAFAFVVLLLAALVFVRRSFYGMRIKVGAAAVAERAAPAAMSARG
jgi:hypothetical protein